MAKTTSHSPATARFPWLALPGYRQAERKGSAAIQAWQLARLKLLLNHALTHSPYYREQYRHLGVSPNDVLSLRDVHALPVQSTDLVRFEQAPKLLDERVNPEDLIPHLTSGSSGLAATFYRSWHEERALGLIRMHENYQMGWRPWHKLAHVRTLFYTKNRNRPQEWAARLGLLRTGWFNCLDQAPDLAEGLKRFRPDLVMGYAQTIADIAQEFLDSGNPDIKDPLIFLGGEHFTPANRKLIRQGFRSERVYEMYGTSEFNLVGLECPETGLLHLSEGGVLLEVLDENNQQVPEGIRGRVVGTALHSFHQPLIRLELGDSAIMGPDHCPCGRPVRTLKKLTGRVVETLRMPDGSRVHGYEILNELAENAPQWVRKFRVIQVDETTVHIEIVAPTASEDQLSSLQKLVRWNPPAGVTLKLCRVDSIPREKSGKFIFCKGFSQHQ